MSQKDVEKRLANFLRGLAQAEKEAKTQESQDSDALRTALLMDGLEQFKQTADRILTSNQDVVRAVSELKIEVPEVKVPDINVPEVKIPEINVPEPKVTVNIPEIKVPKAEVDVKIPEIKVPEPKVTVNVPDVVVPPIKMPEFMNVTGNVGITNTIDEPIPTRIVDREGNDVSFGGGLSAGGSRIDKVSLNNTDGEKINPATEDNQPYLTRFKESLTTSRSSQFNFKPTWGVSTLRYTTTNTGTGATSGETGGEFRLQSGTSNNGEAKIETNQRGQYVPGSMGQAGVGVRVPTTPTSTAYCEWGYTDFTNGFYFGVDATGIYVAYVTGGSVTKIYQSNWNIDKLDGTGDSKLTLDLSEGTISQVDFTWYGYGDIEWSFLIKDHTTNINEKIPVHRVRLEGAVSIIDPNQPLSFRTGNGASGTTNTSLYIGGHQFSVLDAFSQKPMRAFSELLTLYTTATNTNWQPLIAFRKKTNFNGRTNSVLVRLKEFEVAADSDMEVRVTVGGTTSNLTWGAPTSVTATETAVETKVTGGTALTTSADGQPVDYTFVNAGGIGTNRGSTAVDEAEVVLGAGQEIILWIRRQSGTGAMIVKHGHITWEEEW